MNPIVLTLIAIITAAGGQITMKIAMTGGGEMASVASPVEAIVNILSRPLVYLGLVFYGVSAFFWLIALQRLPVSFMYPFTALILVIVTFTSAFFLHEQLGVWRIVGIAIICVGILVMTLDRAQAG